MLGLPPITAVQWRRRAATDWTAYLQTRQRALAEGQLSGAPLDIAAGCGGTDVKFTSAP